MRQLIKTPFSLAIVLITFSLISCESLEDRVLPVNITNTTPNQIVVENQSENVLTDITATAPAQVQGLEATGAPACPLSGTWNGQFGADNACGDVPQNCYACEEPGAAIFDRVKLAFEAGEAAAQKLFIDNKWKKYFPGLDAETAILIAESELNLVSEDDHYVIFIDGEAIFSITF